MVFDRQKKRALYYTDYESEINCTFYYESSRADPRQFSEITVNIIQINIQPGGNKFDSFVLYIY